MSLTDSLFERPLKCGKFEEPPKPGLRLFPGDSDSMWVTTCRRDYYNTGILETLFELGVPLDNGLNRTEWAYAPYMEASQYGLGPKVRLYYIQLIQLLNLMALHCTRILHHFQWS